MAIRMLGANVSNQKGHGEDLVAVKMHDRFLESSGSSWQFCDDVVLKQPSPSEIQKYISIRDRMHTFGWGVKDPRISLFLNAWNQALGNRGHYLILIRHWSACAESLLNRHSCTLAHNTPQPEQAKQHLRFWTEPVLAVNMWLSYYQRVSHFAQRHRERVLLVSQRGLFGGAPVLSELNRRFAFSFDETAATGFDPALLRDKASSNIDAVLSNGLRQQLEELWRSLVELADFTAEDERPVFVQSESPSPGLMRQVREKIADTPRKHARGPGERARQPALFHQLSKAPSGVDVARRLQKGVIRDKEECVRIIGWVSDKYKTDPQVSLHLARLLQQESYYSEAVNQYMWTTGLGLAPPHVFHSLGQCFLALGDDDTAEFFFDRAIRGNPKNPTFHLSKGNLLSEKGLFDEAKSAYEAAVEIAPDNPNVLIQYCEFLDQTGCSEDAIRLMTEYVEKTNPPRIQLMHARVLFKKDGARGLEAYNAFVRANVGGKEERISYLARICAGIDLRSAEEDLLGRIERHWRRAGVDE